MNIEKKRNAFIKKMAFAFMLLTGAILNSNGQGTGTPKLFLDPFRLIIEKKHLSPDYFSKNFKTVPQFKSTGNFDADSTKYWNAFAAWWTKYPADVERVKKIISIDEWQKLISAKKKEIATTSPLRISNSVAGSNSLSGAPGIDKTIAPHAPDINDPDYDNKKFEWKTKYPDEYNRLVNPFPVKQDSMPK